VFFELDQVVLGIVKFGDGSVVNIRGKGTIIFSGCVLDLTLEELDH
jgi:hypothetical protein